MIVWFIIESLKEIFPYCQAEDEPKANTSVVHPNNGSDGDSGVDENVPESPVSNSEDATDTKHNVA